MVIPMTVRHPRYSKEEFARRGDEIYETQVRHQVEVGNHGKIVASMQSASCRVAETPSSFSNC
jgi:hypothetical protein